MSPNTESPEDPLNPSQFHRPHSDLAPFADKGSAGDLPPMEFDDIKTSWLHPTSLIFEFLSHGKELIVPLGLAVFSAANGSTAGLIFAFVFFVPAVFYSVFRYFTLRYKISNGELVVKQGLVFRNVRTVPVGRIQNIDLVQSLLHRLFKVAEVRIETASGTEPEAILRVLSMHRIAELRKLIFDSPNQPKDSLTQVQDVENETGDYQLGLNEPVANTSSTSEIRLLKITTPWLLKAGMASNRGLIILGLFTGLWFQFDLENKIDLDQLKELLPAADGTVASTITIVGLVIAGLLLLRLIGVVWYLMKFHGFQMNLHGEDIRISCGLFTRISATVPRKRIQFISIHRPILLKWMGLASIRIETAGGGGMSDAASTTISRRWFVPVIDEPSIPNLLSHLRPDIEWDESQIEWKALADKAGYRLARLALIEAVIMSAAGFCLSWQVFPQWHPWGAGLGVALLPALLLLARKKAKAMRYSRSAKMLVYRSGVLNRKTSLTFFDKVQTVMVDESPFDRRWKMATLAIDTAAAGPAEHRMTIRYLDNSFAHREHEVIREISSRHMPDFG